MASQVEYESAGTTENDTKEQLRSHSTLQVGEQSKSAGTEGGHVESSNIGNLNDICEKLETACASLEANLNNANSIGTLNDICDKLQTAYESLQANLNNANSVLTAVENEKGKMKQDYDTKLINLNVEYEKLKTAHQTLEESLKNAYSDLKEVEGEKSNMKNELINLNVEYEKLKTARQTLEERLKNAFSDLKEVEGEKSNMKNDLDRFMIDYENLKTTNTDLHESLRSGSEELTAAVEENVNMKKEYENKFKTLSANCQKFKRDNKTLKENLMKWKGYVLEVQKENENMKNNYKFLRAKHEQQKTDLENAHSYIRQLDGDIKKLKQDMDNLKQEKDTLLTRLSKLIGDRLTHDNANIADLSDSDRPTKLSEYFSEMYDNEWTDAFEELTEELSLSDDHAIRRLLDILMNSFHKCKEITWDRYESLSLIASTLHVKEEGIPSTKTTDAEKALTGSQYLDTTKGPETKSKNEPSIRDGEANPLTDDSGDNTQIGDQVVDNQENGQGTDGKKQKSGENTQNEDHGEDNQENGQGAEGQKQDAGANKQNEDQVVENQDNRAGAEGQKQMNVETKTTMLCSALSIEEKTHLKNIWRSSTISLRNESLTMIYTMLSTRFCTPETNLPKTCKYLKVCCDVCWKMFMQEKPMYLEINAEKQIGEDKLFDTERFRAYTKAGKYVAYVVWPALFLHEGGSMLSKGIAQGCNKVPNT